MKKFLFSFIIISVLLSAIFIVSAAFTNLYSGSNAGSGGVQITNTANANGATLENYASAVDDNNHWSADGGSWTFTIADSTNTDTINNATLYIKHYQTGHSNDGFNIDVSDGSTWTTVQSYGGTSPPTSNTTNNWDVSTALNTWTKINNSQVRIIGTGKSGGHDAVTWFVDTVEIRVDTNPTPRVTINLPVSKNYSSSNLNFNVSLNKNGSVDYSLDGGTNNITMVYSADQVSTFGEIFNSTNSSIADGDYTFNAYANSTDGFKNYSESVFFTVDTTFPLISFGNLVENDGKNLSSNSIYANVSITETNFANISFILRNDTGIVNQSDFTSITYDINWTGLTDNNYTYNVSVKDGANNINSTGKRLITLDSTPPVVSNPIQPLSGNNYSNSFTYNVSITDNLLLVDHAIINITNSSGDQNATLTLVKQGTSNYFDVLVNTTHFPEGSYNFTIIANDSLNQINNSVIIHSIKFDNTFPTFTLNAPVNDTITLINSTLINITLYDNNDVTIIKIFGGNDSSFFNNNSLIYKRKGLVNNTEIIYNWSSPVLNVTENTILLMHFDLEGSDNETHIEDETGFNNGTKKAINEPLWNSTEAKFGYSLDFDGIDDEISIPDSNSLDLSGNFSISFWAYLKNKAINQTFLSKGADNIVNYFIDYKNVNDGQIEFGFFNTAFRSIAVNASIITSNNWSLITTTWNNDTNTSRVYINGIDKGSFDLDYNILTNTNPLKIGSFPGYSQNYSGLLDELIIYNKTLSSSEVSNIYSFSLGKYYWFVELNDTANNFNISETRTIDRNPIWTISTIDLGSIGAALNTNLSLGTLLFNNTHNSKNLTLNLTNDYEDGSFNIVYYNDSNPFNINNTIYGNNSFSLQINISTNATEGTETIKFNISANDTQSGLFSIPKSRIVTVDVVKSGANPVLISKFESPPTVVSQNNTGISLTASVVNRGQGSAQNVKINFSIPNGWTNSSGNLIQSLGILTINEQKNATVTVDINTSATPGTNTLFANLSGQNSSSDELTPSYLTIGSANVTVNDISAGAGPSEITTAGSTTSSSSSGGGGGGYSSSSGGSSSSQAFSQVIEITRGIGGEATFNISITPKYINSSLNNLGLNLLGYPSQYISIYPQVINNLHYGEVKDFEVTLSSPSYSASEEYNLTALISGNLLLSSGSIQPYSETHSIQLIIQTIGLSPLEDILFEAEQAIEEMKSAGFNTKNLEKLLIKSKELREQRKNQASFDLAQEIIDTKNKAFSVNNLILNILSVLKNPKQLKLITENIPKEFKDINGNVIQIRSVLTGNVIFDKSSTLDLINLAKAAFEKGDFIKAEELAKQAQISAVLSIKGNFGLFLQLYWYLIIFGILIFALSSLLGYRGYQKSSLSKKIDDINKEENNIQKILVSNQQNYFNGKISPTEFHKIEDQFRKRVSQIQKKRINFRNRRVRILKPQQISKDLKFELTQIEAEIKSIQKSFYIDKKIPELTYKLMFKGLNERIAELEREKATLHILEMKNENKKKKHQ